MFIKNLLVYSIVLCALSFCFPLLGQDHPDYIKVIRDVSTDRKAILASYMDFSEQEASVISPLYAEYMVERKSISDKYEDLLTLYVRVYDDMSDEVGKVLVKKHLEIKKERYKLNKRYAKKFVKALGYSRGAKLIQLNNQLDLVLETSIAAALPLIE